MSQSSKLGAACTKLRKSSKSSASLAAKESSTKTRTKSKESFSNKK